MQTAAYFDWESYDREESERLRRNPNYVPATVDLSAIEADPWGAVRHAYLGNADRYAIRFLVKGGGAVTVERAKVSFDTDASFNTNALLAGIIHAKQHWGGAMTVTGSGRFQDAAYQLAQRHGVTVIRTERPAVPKPPPPFHCLPR
jgi:tartrate dehydratase alpha subunit/fumarate hydratase class I-like protein